MLAYDFEPAIVGKVFSEYDYIRKYQSTDESVKFKSLRRELTYNGLTVGEVLGEGTPSRLVTSEAIGTLADFPTRGFLPDVIMADVLEGTRYAGYARTIANVYPAPAGQPLLYYRKHERFRACQRRRENAGKPPV